MYPHLCNAIREAFPVPSVSKFPFFPFCNETNWEATLSHIQQSLVTPPGKLGIALLFGESHFISLSSYLSPEVSILLMADIEPKLHHNTRLLLDCLEIAATPEEFMSLYLSRVNEIVHDSRTTNAEWLDAIKDDLLTAKDELGDKHFLFSQERYSSCKQTMARLIVVRIGFDLFNVEQATRLRHLLDTFNAEFSLINVTNIPEYELMMDFDPTGKKSAPSRHTMSILIRAQATNTNVMYSKYPLDRGGLVSYIVSGFIDYLKANR